MASVTYDHVTKRFGETAAVNELELAIQDGEFMVLVGPSGCGKSTALRMLAGLEKVSDGRILIGDRVINNVAPQHRDIAMVFQSYALYPHMTVYDNLAFGLRNQKVPQKEIDESCPSSGRDSRPRPADQAQAQAALGRPAAARRSGPRDRARARRVPHGRATVESRCEASRPDACPDLEAPERPGHDDDLRYARSSRGNDDGRPHRRDEFRRPSAGRLAGRALPRSEESVRRRLHRITGDEPRAGGRSRRRRRSRPDRRPQAGAHRPRQWPTRRRSLRRAGRGDRVPRRRTARACHQQGHSSFKPSSRSTTG